MKTNSYHKNIFDGIFICNGRLSHPNMPIPKIHGTDNFKGTQIHSHDFRRAERYTSKDSQVFFFFFFLSNHKIIIFLTDKNVLLIGYGPSGIDLAFMLSEVTNHLYISHHNSNTICPEKSDKKPAIRELTADGVIFTNGEEHKIDDIIYCTGYKVSFPFLSVDCGISVEDNIISPLYKQCLNINYPTMGIIGITYMGTNTVNNQIQYVLNVLSGEIHLPSKEIMKTDSDYHVNFRRTLPNRSKEVEGVAPYVSKISGKYNINKVIWWSLFMLLFFFFFFQLEYYKQLVGEADLGNVPSVYLQLYEDSLERRKTHPGEFRNDVYRIIDNLHFERNKLNE